MAANIRFSLAQVAGVAAIALSTLVLLAPAVGSLQDGPKEASLLKFKAAAAATLLYAADNDHLLPLMAGSNDGGMIRYFSFHRVPAGWQRKSPYNSPQRIEQDRQIWANSVRPYFSARAGNDPWYQPGLPLSMLVEKGKVDPKLNPLRVGISYNGLLHAWALSAIAKPEVLPLYSGSLYRQNLEGLAISNPSLMCMSPGGCRFNPNQHPSGRDQTGEGDAWMAIGKEDRQSIWIFDKGMNFASADGSVYWRSFQAIPNWPTRAFNVNKSPWSALDGSAKRPPGAPYWLTYCAAPGGTYSPKTVSYAGYFRPDSTFDWTKAECD